MNEQFLQHIKNQLIEIEQAGMYKRERQITSKQAGRIDVNLNGAQHDYVVNLCANNYLGLADNQQLVDVAKTELDEQGLGMASVRFICGTKDSHRELEQKLAKFLGKQDSILFAACFDANGGLFEPLLTQQDAIISDSLNHASIIDGIRLCKAQRYRYQNSDMTELEQKLIEAKENGARYIMIATDGVFSMDGYLAKLPEITALAKKYNALVMVDDCHATGFMGPQGRGTPAHFNVSDDVDLLTGTLGKALGGSIGGYIAGPQPIIDLLRQRARPYLFSNSLPPMIVAAGIEAIKLVEVGDDLRTQLFENTRFWREGLVKLGFDLLAGSHPIVPVMLGEAKLAQDMAAQLFDEGVFVAGFFFPVVPKGKARIRTQMNASLTRKDLEFALAAFEKVGKSLGIIK
ncbi:MAG: glycine C-acetyltransferase [OCS116 cluster bacterium]|uniref:2-amino-3-ketobutyrate coenzyme A ligase n=1 Tax=OCS116 cluster bacterium TaxID=2030921 RepID=A0A2A4ZAW8_9PROT|nr:glycine C-acetyltransferase [OCS116 cluster bacterium]